jgi:predicted nucleic acid-binding protein
MIAAVCDSSSLILLARTGFLDWLFTYAEVVLIPKAVYREVVIRGKIALKPDALAVEQEIKKGRIKIAHANKHTFQKMLEKQFRLGEGEAESISLAHEKRPAFLAIDDFEGIKAAKVYGIPFITALSLLVKLSKDMPARKNDAIFGIKQLERIGYYSNNLIKLALKEVNGNERDFELEAR